MKLRPGKIILISTTSRILDIVSWSSLVIIWLITILTYPTLPAEIPIHFNFNGIADNFGSKNEIFNLPIIASALVVGLAILNKFLCSTMEVKRREKAENLIITNGIIKLLNIAIPLIFGLIIYHTIEIAKNKNQGLGYWLIIVCIAILNIPNVYYFAKFIITKRGKK